MDLRSLGLWRIALGLLMLLDWLTRSFHLRAHYTAQGVLPLSGHLNQPDLLDRYWSVFYLNDSTWFVVALFLLGMTSSLALTLGYRTRWSGWIAWILLLGVQHRNPLILTKGDSYLVLLLFWGNFLPWDRAFAVDANEEPARQGLESPVISWPAFCYLAQVCLLYWFTALLRTGPSWQVDGSALYLSFQLEHLVKEPGYLMLGLGSAWLSFWTFAALAMELLGPFLLLVPSARVRMLAVAAIVVFHLGILMTLEVFNFSWVCMVAPLGLLPSLFWKLTPGSALQRRLSSLAETARTRWPQSLSLVAAPSGAASPSLPLHRLGQLVPALALLGALVYLVFDLHGLYKNSPFMEMTRAVGIGQTWGMFSPDPPRVSGWQSARARLSSGTELDLITGKPYPAQGEYQGERGWRDQRWGIFRSMMAANPNFEILARGYLLHLVRQWDNRHPEDPVVEADYLWHSRITQADYLLPYHVPQVKARYRP